MTARQQLQKFMAKYDPALAIQAKQALAKLRKLLPGAVEMIYDTYNALVIGFVPGERASQAVFSLALYPQYFNLFFAWGKGLPDPGKFLQGSGHRVRRIRWDSPATLDESEVREPIKVAMNRGPVPFDPKLKSRTIIKAVSKKQRPRRPGKNSVQK